MGVDGFRFLGGPTRRVMRAWQEREPTPAVIPWTPLVRPLREARIALISTAAVRLVDDEPFDQDGERSDPWWGDPTYRVFPRDVPGEAVRIDHMHIDPRPASSDLDCLMPLRRLDALVADGLVGSSAPHHYSFMGYILKPRRLLEESAPKIAEALVKEEVDLALLIPV
jgi:D-proline reductase (dithiol) PrdB